MSKKAEAKAPEVVDGFAQNNARCVESIDTIEYHTRRYRMLGEPITECVMRLLAEVMQFRADEVHATYVTTRKNRMDAEKGGAQ